MNTKRKNGQNRTNKKSSNPLYDFKFTDGLFSSNNLLS